MRTPPSPGTDAQRILVIDDDLDQARSLAVLMRRMGHDCQYALDAVSGLAVAQRQVPDIVFLDLRLPGTHGTELARQLRRDPKLRQARILAMSGLCSLEDRDEALDAGCDEVLVKPVPIPVFQLLVSGTATPL